MQIHKALVLLGLAAILVWGTGAQDEGIKIGVVDIDQAISSTTEGKAAREEFARKQRDAEAKVQPMIEKYQGLEEDLKQKKFVLSDEALFQKQLDLASMRNEIETKMKELENQLQVDQKRLEAPLTKASFPARLNAGASVRTRALVFAATASPPDQDADSQVQPAEPAPEGDVLQALG